MPERTQLLVIGGSDAGTAAALRAREIDPALDVTMLVADTYVNHSVCGLPFLVSGEVADWQSLAHRTEDEIAAGARPVRPAKPRGSTCRASMCSTRWTTASRSGGSWTGWVPRPPS